MVKATIVEKKIPKFTLQILHSCYFLKDSMCLKEMDTLWANDPFL